MSKTRTRALSPRSIEIRHRWQQRLEAQRASGVAQTQWCRQNGIDPKYFSLWKSKLSKLGASPVPSTPVNRLVPVIVRPDAKQVAPPASVGLSVTLPNGVSVRFECSDALGVGPLLRELAGLAC
jgi:hypothetical protein